MTTYVSRSLFKLTTMFAVRMVFAVGMVAVGFCLVATCVADTIHDTTGSPDDAFQLVGRSNSGSGNINQPADSFVVAGGSFTLDTITVQLDDTSLQAAGTPDDYEIRIWDNNLGRPGTLLEAITIPGSDTLPGTDITVSSILNVLLSDGSTYWVSAALPDDMSFGLIRAVQAASNGRAVAFLGSSSPDWFLSGATNAFRMKVTGTLVPEPTCLSLVGFVLIGAASARRRRR